MQEINKIFIGMVEVAGYFGNLKKGLEELGIKCTFFYYDHKFKYSDKEKSSDDYLDKLLKYFGNKRNSTPRTDYFHKIIYVLFHILILTAVFIKYLFSHDVFIFTFGDSFFSSNIDLPIIKLMKKKVIFIFGGSDHRPPYINGVFVALHKQTANQCIKLAHNMKRRVKTIEKYADLIIGHHLASHFHEKPFIPAMLLGFPVSLLAVCGTDPSQDSLDRDSVVIVHAPSTPETKGTVEIRQAIASLKTKGHSIDFIEISGQPHATVLAKLSHCDFVVDELYSDARLAGLGTEASVFGKPVIVGGYANDDFLKIEHVFSTEQFPPVIYCAPVDVERSIKRLIVDKEYRLKLGAEARQFVVDNWAPMKVAERYLKLISGDIPDSWLYDPQRICYIYGTGLPAGQIKNIVRQVIRIGGIQSLQLSDKPQLEKLFFDFAHIPEPDA